MNFPNPNRVALNHNKRVEQDRIADRHRKRETWQVFRAFDLSVDDVFRFKEGGELFMVTEVVLGDETYPGVVKYVPSLNRGAKPATLTNMQRFVGIFKKEW